MADDEARKFRSEAIRNYVTAFAVIVGGGWAVFEFAALERVERAQLEREIAEGERARQRREDLRAAMKEPTLAIEFDANVVIQESDKHIVMGKILLTNISDLRVDIPNSAGLLTIQIVRLLPGPNGTPLTSDRQAWVPRDHTGPIAGFTVLPGRTIAIPYVFWVEAPGIYLLSYQSVVDEGILVQDDAIREKYGLDKILWSETKLVRVLERASAS